MVAEFTLGDGNAVTINMDHIDPFQPFSDKFFLPNSSLSAIPCPLNAGHILHILGLGGPARTGKRSTMRRANRESRGEAFNASAYCLCIVPQPVRKSGHRASQIETRAVRLQLDEFENANGVSSINSNYGA